MIQDKIPSNYLAISEEEVAGLDWKAYIKDETTGKCYVIPYGTWYIGRKDEDREGCPENMEVSIPIETEDLYMSRVHAVMTLRKNIIGENSLFIRDTKSRKNSTLVDGFSIENYYDFQVFDNSVLRIGRTLFSVWLNPLNK